MWVPLENHPTPSFPSAAESTGRLARKKEGRSSAEPHRRVRPDAPLVRRQKGDSGMMEHARILAIAGVAFFLFCLVGCVSDEANRYYLKETLPPKSAKEVEVLREAPQRPYTVIADLQANDASVRYMQKRAAQIGADAVIVVPVGGYYSRDEVWAGKDRNSKSYARMLGTAIKYNPEP